MPYFQVMLAGRDIQYASADGSDPSTGFHTSRLVKAADLEIAHRAAKELVFSEWQADGPYAAGNQNGSLKIEIGETWQVGLLVALFKRRRIGYVFFTHESETGAN